MNGISQGRGTILPLQQIDLTDCQRLASLKTLDNIKSLKRVTVTGCRLLPDEEIERFERQNPNVEVVR